MRVVVINIATVNYWCKNCVTDVFYMACWFCLIENYLSHVHVIFITKKVISVCTLREINLQALYNVFYKLIFMVRLDVVSGPWEKNPMRILYISDNFHTHFKVYWNISYVLKNIVYLLFMSFNLHWSINILQ